MAQPTPYSKATDFAADERANAGGRSTIRTDRLDAELAAVATTLTQTLANLARIQRDDGKLMDGIVELYHLSAACRAAIGIDITPRGLWATLTAYAPGDLVDVNGIGYLCPTGKGHTAGTFADDYAAGYWQVFGAVPGAGGMEFIPPATMTSTNVQDAIEEVNTRARNTVLPSLAAFYGAL